MSGTLPAPIPDPINDPDLEQRKRLAALAESALRFRRSAADALDELICEQILRQMNVGWNQFNTPNGRPCVVVLGVGEDVVRALTMIVTRMGGDEPDPNEDLV